MSVFILSGAELRATMNLEGPIAPMSINSGAELQQAIDTFASAIDHTDYSIVQEVVDFEHIQIQAVTEEDDDDDFHAVETGDDGVPEGEDVNSEAFLAKQEQRRQQAQLARTRAREARRKRDQMREETQRKVRDEGEPFQRTLKAKADGWYRACVRGTWYQVRCVNSSSACNLLLQPKISNFSSFLRLSPRWK